jgi:hypothetical protein
LGWDAWGGANLGGILGVGGLGWVKLGVGCLGRGKLWWDAWGGVNWGGKLGEVGLWRDSILKFLLWELLSRTLSFLFEYFEFLTSTL